MRKSLLLTPMVGGVNKYVLATPEIPGNLLGVIPATMGLVSPAVGSVEPTLSGLSATGYTQVIEDSTGAVFKADSAVWVADGLNAFVDFPEGVPAVMIPPLRLTFFRYTGTTGGGPAGPTPVALRAPSVAPATPLQGGHM